MSESVYRSYLSAYAQAMTGGIFFLPATASTDECTAAALGVYDGKKGDRPRSRRDVESDVRAALLMPEPEGSAGSTGSAP